MYNQWEHVMCDVSSDEELENVFNDLKVIAPHIKWRISYCEHELGDYSVLEVPEEFLPEAEYIIEKYEEGYDFTNYTYKNRFPNTFIDNNGTKRINPNIEAFYKLAKEFMWTVDDFHKIGLYSFIKKMLILLPKLYLAGLELEFDVYDANINNQELSYDSLDFGEYDVFFDIEDIFKNEQPEEYSLTEIIDSLVEDFQSGVFQYEEADVETMAAIAYDWHISFSTRFGGGYIAKLIKAFDYINRSIEGRCYNEK